VPGRARVGGIPDVDSLPRARRSAIASTYRTRRRPHRHSASTSTAPGGRDAAEAIASPIKRRIREGLHELHRSDDERLVGGVCGGIGEWLRVDATPIRIVVVALSLIGGSGVIAYALAWMLMPRRGHGSILRRVRTNRRELRLAFAAATVALVLVVALQAIGIPAFGPVLFTAGVAALGLFVIWRGADDEERHHLAALIARTPLAGLEAPRRGWATLWRVAFGLVALSWGISRLATVVHSSGIPTRTLLGMTAVLAGIGALFGPWWWRVLRDLGEERRERVRAQERFEVAAHLHDSVLQTLALIQGAADDPARVRVLARAQERELRSWLFRGAARPAGDEVADLTAVVGEMVSEIEELFNVRVEAVVVGGCPVDERARALLAAAREAVVNAARWSGVGEVSLFVESDGHQLSAFVRDRGRGFDPSRVDEEHRGISHSIVGRVERLGGRASITSQPDKGTEVELTVALRGQL
jgi:signal transduction histidine kinase